MPFANKVLPPAVLTVPIMVPVDSVNQILLSGPEVILLSVRLGNLMTSSMIRPPTRIRPMDWLALSMKQILALEAEVRAVGWIAGTWVPRRKRTRPGGGLW